MASKKRMLDEKTINELDALFESAKNKEEKLIVVDGKEGRRMSFLATPFPVEKLDAFDWCDAFGIRRILK